MKLAREQKARGEGEKEQRGPGPLAHRAKGGLQRLWVDRQPAVEPAYASEDLGDGHCGHGQERAKLHHGLEGDGQAEARVPFPRRDVARSEKQRKERHQRAEDEAHQRSRRPMSEEAHALGDGANLKREVGQVAGQHEERHEDACTVALEAKGEEVRQRSELVLARQSQHGLPHHGDEEA